MFSTESVDKSVEKLLAARSELTGLKVAWL